MKHAFRFRLIVPLLACISPAAVLADLNQTNLLTAGDTINLDSGVAGTSGGDIQWTSSGITPQGSATAVNLYTNWPVAQFNTISVFLVELSTGYSKSTIPTSKLAVGDVFGVHTNGGHWAKVIVTATTATSLTVQFTTFGVAAGPGSGNAGPPAITAIRNNSSGISAGLPNYGITPSSIFVIAGTGLADPGTPTLQSSAAPGLPLTLNGASISVTVNGVAVHPAIYYTSPTQIAAVLPASTPVGTGTVTVTYNGVASNAEPIVVVPAALGINFYYSNSAVATDAVTGALLTYTDSGTPGENITLWTTGLGADTADSDTTYTSTPHAITTPLQIYIGGTPATILYQGSAGYPGVDQINVTIPASTPSGCWTGIAAVSGGVLSNITTIPVTSSGGVCEDTVNGLSGNQLAPVLSTQTLRTGFMAIVQTNKAGSNVFSTNSDGAFEAYTGIYSPSNPVSPGGCIVYQLVPVSVGAFTGLDPGTIMLEGPNGLSLPVPNQLGIKGAFSAALTAGAIPQTGGTFTFKGSGGADVGSFTSVIDFSNPLLSWTNPDVAASIDRSQDLKVTWTGGNAGSYVFITGESTPAAASTLGVGFTCLANAGDGQFTVPSYILSALPRGTGGIGIQNDIYAKIPASGLDISFAQGEIGIGVNSTYK